MKAITLSYPNPHIEQIHILRKGLFLFFVLLALLLTGCKKETDVNPAGTLTANAGTDQQVQVGQVVSLDGGSSQDSKGKPFTMQWTIVRKPAKSTVTLTGTTTAKPTFTPDEVGEYELQLTISNENGKSTDNVVIVVSAAQPVTISQSITVKTVLTDRIINPDLPDYIVTKAVDIQAELTINPGVVIAFERDTRMNINDNGGLIIAKGEANRKIRFIGVEKTKGFWAGLTLYSGSNANVFEYVEVLHAGSRTLYSTIKAGMYIAGTKAQIAIKNSLFAENSGYGLYVQDGGIIREFAQNTFSNNTESGMMLSADNVPVLDVASVFTGGNGRNVVEVMGSTIKGTSEVEWTPFTDKTPYRINGELTVTTGWWLNPGVTLEMARDAVIRINTDGYLSARGTATNKITITGAERTAAFWKGIICYSASAQNILDNADISNAGSSVIVSAKKTNVAIYGTGAKMAIKNTRISGSGGYGLFVSYGSSVNTDVMTANTFESNAQTNVLIEK
ncbi:right-handed parallel beta-helix repeat-containing protein [Spirosoma sp. HMF4905]|uniref:Right-handed parallel beta-helix repeat-containing protein n=1 Tax=Spirosoma arboris TaxID=2682092 RepID=A0A7K1SD00_9BACT|nr:right-handed parallel beta-helix repeat-containing protein [Spirosoma arboris]MVM31436.1 right-handed parallel beta-helix repeat-containing protein [Spirosoma arboris]